jgi:serine/threonine-protein phosphatase 6 regulatory subunit 3
MLAFIRSQPNVIERILAHIETPSFVDLLMRIIQLDEIPSGAGVLEVSILSISITSPVIIPFQWLSEENLMGRLIDMLSPSHSSDVHTVVADVIKGIISMAAPSPGAGLTEGLQNGPASNRFARELAHRSRLLKLAGYMVDEFNVVGNSPTHDDSEPDHGLESRSSDYPTLPSLASATSSVVQSISVVIELIRKNNSDYFEPYLFHTIRNRLMDVQQHLQNVMDGREELEQVMTDMVDRMRVVHLGSVLEVMCDCMEAFQRYLRHPRSLVRTYLLASLSFRVLWVLIIPEGWPNTNNSRPDASAYF